MRISNLATHLARRGHDVSWWSSTHSHQQKRCLVEQDADYRIEAGYALHLRHVGGYRRNIGLGRVVHHGRLARRLYQEWRGLPAPDLILCCHPIIELGFASLMLARRTGAALVIDVRDPWPDLFLTRIPRQLAPLARLALLPYFWMTRQIFRDATSVVAVSQGWLAWAQRTGGRREPGRDTVVYHGAQAPQVHERSPRADQVLESLEGRFLCVYVGEFGGVYDLETVGGAARQLHELGRSDIQFVLVGSGGKNFSRTRERYGSLPNVTMPGWLHRPDLDRLLSRCHVGIIPWTKAVPDAMPNKFFEYLAAGLPILSSALGEMAGLLERHCLGCFYPPGDAPELARLVARLADDTDLRRAMASNARRIFQERFDAELVYSNFAEHLEKVAARR